MIVRLQKRVYKRRQFELWDNTMAIKEHQAARQALMEIRGANFLHSADMQMKRLAIALEAILDDLEYLRTKLDALAQEKHGEVSPLKAIASEDTAVD